ncbi:MAG: PDZ domain-containing protein [Candidatus Hydrogenedentes bacterium]|nr:PDZ domain-containing protein [Candidatus Hydrogenedentota bacterium]
MSLRLSPCLIFYLAIWIPIFGLSYEVGAQTVSEAKIEEVVAKVKPALVRIRVVFAEYDEGREIKYEATGSGVIITKEGHVVTNHHVAGHATRLFCTMATKEEIEAELVGKDPLTDIAVIKLNPRPAREFPVAAFGDSDQMNVGDGVLAMGSPMALSQSVTLGIVSNTEMIMPSFMGPWSRVTEDGEDVGSFVRWIGHDAPIYPGNSGGPLVNINGEIIGINEIWAGLSGAIPGNLAKAVADQIISQSRVKRSWLGVIVQPRLKHSPIERGILVSGALKGSPADQAGLMPGDVVVRLAGQDVDVRFEEELPAFNRLVAEQPIGKEMELLVLRNNEEKRLAITPIEREEAYPQQQELKQWGITARNLSFVIAKEMKLDSTDGVLVTSIRPGGPAGDAKPPLAEETVIAEVNGKPIKNLDALKAVTEEITQGKTEPVPTLVAFEQKGGRIITVAKVGIKELEDPGVEVQKAWLPVESQVITRDIARQLGKPDLMGFRITEIYPDSAAQKAGLQVGDLITALDGEPLEASAPEHYEILGQRIRQYKIGTVAQLTVIRGDQNQSIPVELLGAPKESKEMKKYRDENFEFTARDITYKDKVREKWPLDQSGVLVEEVKPGGWATLGKLDVGDLILEIDGEAIQDAERLEKKMKAIANARPEAAVFQVRRGIHTLFLEFEPKWENVV